MKVRLRKKKRPGKEKAQCDGFWYRVDIWDPLAKEWAFAGGLFSLFSVALTMLYYTCDRMTVMYVLFERGYLEIFYLDARGVSMIHVIPFCNVSSGCRIAGTCLMSFIVCLLVIAVLAMVFGSKSTIRDYKPKLYTVALIIILVTMSYGFAWIGTNEEISRGMLYFFL